MLNAKELGYEKKVKTSKVSKGKMVGIFGTVVSALAVAAGVNFFLTGQEPVEELPAPLADFDVELSQPFVSLQQQPALLMGSVDVWNLDREGRAALIASKLEQQRETVFTAAYGNATVETNLGALGLDLREDLNVILDRLESMEEGFAQMTTSQLRLPLSYELAFDTSAAAIAEWAEQLAWQFSVPATEPGLSMARRGNFRVTSGQEGSRIDTAQLIADTLSATSTGNIRTVEMSSYAVSPRFSEASLQNIDTPIARFSSQFETGIGRARNVELGAEIINGHVIMPGEVFDYNSVFPAGTWTEHGWISGITAENGFVYGTIFLNGRAAQGLGGGLCQVSSTLYGAILRLGIVPTQSLAHSNRVHYVPGGLDACMWTEPGHPCNLIFTNTLDVPIYLTATANNGNLVVEFWSEADALGAYTFEPRSAMIERNSMHEIWNSWLRTYRNGSFVSEQFLRHDVYVAE